VGPGNQPAASVLGQPVADLRTGETCLPDVGEDVGERLRLLAGNDEVASVAADHFVAPEAGRALACLVEEQDAPVPIEDAHERLRRLCENSCELVAEDEIRCL